MTTFNHRFIRFFIILGGLLLPICLQSASINDANPLSEFDKFTQSLSLDKIKEKDPFDTENWTQYKIEIDCNLIKLRFKEFKSTAEAKQFFEKQCKLESMISRRPDFSVGEEYFILGTNRVAFFRNTIVVKIEPETTQFWSKKIFELTLKFDSYLKTKTPSSKSGSAGESRLRP